MKLYHNPSCMKSREARKLLEEEGAIFDVIDYQKNPLTHEELSALIKKLGIAPKELIRKNEGVFKEFYKGKDLDGDQWIDAMIKYPKLMERPILANDKKAVIGRPPANVLQLI